MWSLDSPGVSYLVRCVFEEIVVFEVGEEILGELFVEVLDHLIKEGMVYTLVQTGVPLRIQSIV